MKTPALKVSKKTDDPLIPILHKLGQEGYSDLVDAVETIKFLCNEVHTLRELVTMRTTDVAEEVKKILRLEARVKSIKIPHESVARWIKKHKNDAKG